MKILTFLLVVASISTTVLADEVAYDALIDGDCGKAEQEIKRLAVRGESKAQRHLGIMYYRGYCVSQDYESAALWLRRAAEQGDVEARYRLAQLYLLGRGVKQDDIKAASFYLNAAQQGHTLAKNDLTDLNAARNRLSEEEGANTDYKTETENNTRDVVLASGRKEGRLVREGYRTFPHYLLFGKRLEIREISD